MINKIINKKKNLIDFLYVGDMSLKHRKRVYQDIQEANRKSIVVYAGCSGLAFLLMTLFTLFFDSDVTKNKTFYIFGMLFMAVLLFLNLSIAKKYKSITPVSAYDICWYREWYRARKHHGAIKKSR